MTGRRSGDPFACCAVSRSAEAICGTSRRGFVTATPNVTRFTAAAPQHFSRAGREHLERPPGTSRRASGPTIMKFVLVNHRTPCGPSSCLECCRPLRSGYLREVATQRPYCDYDCYRRYEAKSLLMPWLAFAQAGREPVPAYSAHLDMISSFAAASCWYSIVVAKAALRVGELVTAEAFGT